MHTCKHTTAQRDFNLCLKLYSKLLYVLILCKQICMKLLCILCPQLYKTIQYKNIFIGSYPFINILNFDMSKNRQRKFEYVKNVETNFLPFINTLKNYYKIVELIKVIFEPSINRIITKFTFKFCPNRGRLFFKNRLFFSACLFYAFLNLRFCILDNF